MVADGKICFLSVFSRQHWAAKLRTRKPPCPENTVTVNVWQHRTNKSVRLWPLNVTSNPGLEQDPLDMWDCSSERERARWSSTQQTHHHTRPTQTWLAHVQRYLGRALSPSSVFIFPLSVSCRSKIIESATWQQRLYHVTILSRWSQWTMDVQIYSFLSTYCCIHHKI